MTKPELRSAARRRVDLLSREERRAASAASAARLAGEPEFRAARVVLAYLALPDEMDADGVIAAALADGRRVCVPRADWGSRALAAVEIRSIGVDVGPPGRHGLREPRVGEGIDPAEIDFVLAPGVTFDTLGGRLGRGAGFYDRFFADPRLRAVRCGFAFEVQLAERVPAEPHDARMDMLVTEQRVLRFGRS
ncbi:MAG: 5-formyltetrahydrofolate cyclo-ligase [Planctomycetia bacterium]|nr:MAG: 5-formyltetrahydrofolate cyclo-ligase [Planctomycetia bacterium]